VQADELAERMRPILEELAHLPSARQIAAELNRRRIKSATGGQWSSKAVTRLRATYQQQLIASAFRTRSELPPTKASPWT
jgi:Recombinase